MQDIKKMLLFAQKHPHILYQGRREFRSGQTVLCCSSGVPAGDRLIRCSLCSNDLFGSEGIDYSTVDFDHDRHAPF